MCVYHTWHCFQEQRPIRLSYLLQLLVLFALRIDLYQFLYFCCSRKPKSIQARNLIHCFEILLEALPLHRLSYKGPQIYPLIYVNAPFFIPAFCASHIRHSCIIHSRLLLAKLVPILQLTTYYASFFAIRP